MEAEVIAVEAKLIVHASQIATPTGFQARKGTEMDKVSFIQDGAVYIENGVIIAVGKTEDVLRQIGDKAKNATVIHAEGKCVVPGFVDSHTHFIFGGYRSEEFVKRLHGASYLSILKEGGGIQSTVKSTREASFESLYKDGLERMDDMMQQGVTTLEGKSGYGLDLETEVKQLRVIKKLQETHVCTLKSTYLGGHAVPPEYAERSDAYVDYMVHEVLPVIKQEGLAEFCDVFCEDDVFSIPQSKKLLTGAQQYGFKAKIHADEIVSLGGAELAAEIDAVSADHLLMASDNGIRLLAEKNVTATLLPCTAFCLNKPYANARKMMDAGCAVALASDYNPGSCFTNSIPLIIALAVIHMHMTMAETLTALTLNGAAALDCADCTGSIEPGKQADLLILKYPDYRFLVYHTGKNIVESVMKKGELVWPQMKR